MILDQCLFCIFFFISFMISFGRKFDTDANLENICDDAVVKLDL